MSEISEMMPVVTALLAAGQMPSADQIRRMLVVIDKQDAEIDRLNKWADGFSDAQLKERRLCEERIKELQASRERLKSAIEFAHAEGFQWPSDPMAEFAQSA